MLKGVVHGTGGGLYRVSLEDGRVVDATLRGRLKREQRTGDRIVIGDRVAVEPADEESFTIERVDERTTEIVRSAPGGRRPKVVAANLDRLVAVMAVADPVPRTEQIDRLLVIAESSDLGAVLVLNKVDLPDSGQAVRLLRSVYQDHLGYRVLAVSARSGAGIDGFRELVCVGRSALIGPSGVGKSSLLNAAEPGLGLRTGELSRKVRRGRHTTVSARLIELSCGGLVADTPGFGDVGVWGVDPDTVERCFREISALASRCRFHDCAHLVEPGCAVREAVEDGRVVASRYESYRSLREEARRTGRGG